MITIPGRIPIQIFPLFWLLIFLIGWLNTETFSGTLTWGVVIFFSILIHEYGHALTALAFGQNAEISLLGLGGVTRRQGKTIKLWQEFLVILNGPLAGFALFFLSSKLQPAFDPHRFKILAYGIEVSLYVNLFWNILNLLPILPLDGGHLVRVMLEGFFGFNGIKFSLILSIVLAALGSLIFFSIHAFLGGALFLMFAFESYRAWSELKHIKPHDTSAHLQDLLKEAEQDFIAGKNEEALSKFILLRDQAKEGLLYVAATQNIARILIQEDQLQQAYEILLPVESKLSIEYQCILQQLAYHLQEWEKALQVGIKVYREEPFAQVALINALSCALMGKAKQSVGWLRCVLQSGVTNFSEVIRKKEFDSIRNTPDFQAFIHHNP